ncbi:MAG: sporulation membrane protein YtaF [Caloramator sp.]|nr:sporulation membrane protein YtaF [Caloramator sp.]
MNILLILLFSISSSSDNFIIGISYGIQKISISFLYNLIIAFISCIGTFISMLLGKILTNFISPFLANILGAALLIILGLYMQYNSYKSKKNNNLYTSNTSKIECYENIIMHPEIIDSNKSKTIELKESILLGSILCLNNIGLGIGVSILGLNIYITSLSSMIFSLVFIKLGSYIGSKVLSDKLVNYSEIISSWIIILLGLYELFL